MCPLIKAMCMWNMITTEENPKKQLPICFQRCMHGNMHSYADPTEMAEGTFRVCGEDSPAVSTHAFY